MKSITFAIIVLYTCLINTLYGQSNVGLQGNGIEYQGEGLPEETILDGKVTKLDELSPVIFLNRTKAVLNCAEGLMQIELKFEEPFYGIAYADFDRNSACQITGKGDYSYSIDLPLKGCGTQQSPLRVFTNNIVVRFHPSLEIDGDEIITVVCRYPPPIVPPPPGLSRYIKEESPPQNILSTPLNGTQILFIMCAVLFLTLVLFGLAGSYYCLRHRRITVIRRNPYSLGSSSEITKLSGSSIGSNGFEEVKIPRVHTQIATTHSSSGSEGALIPSDYPSESLSEVEDLETRSFQISSGGSYENKAYIQETDSYFSEQNFIQGIHPKIKIRKPTTTITTEDSSMSKLEKNLTTILESNQRVEPVTRTKIEQETYECNEENINETTSTFKPVKQEKTMTTTEISESMYEEKNSMKKTPPPPIIPIKKLKTTTIENSTEETLEEYEMRKKLMKMKNRDDNKWNVRLRKISINEDHNVNLEWENFSDVSSVSNMTMTPKLERSHLSFPHVNNLSNEHKEPLFSPDLVGTINQHTPLSTFATREISDSKDYISQYNIPFENSSIVNWEILIRVFQPEKYAEANVDVESLTVVDKMVWKKIIMNESSLRTELSKASDFDDFVRISSDKRYKNLFEPHKWDVIIRLLSVPTFENYTTLSSSSSSDDSVNSNKNAIKSRKQESVSYTRKNSLPTLYEHDFMKKQNNEILINKESRLNYKSEVSTDLRSMSEMTVDFNQIDYSSNEIFDSEQRNLTNNQSYLIRSSSQPSLVRSASEFTEFWIAPEQESEISSQYSTQKFNQTVNNGRNLSIFDERKKHSKQTNRNWFDDNESETSFRF